MAARVNRDEFGRDRLSVTLAKEGRVRLCVGVPCEGAVTGRGASACDEGGREYDVCKRPV